MGNNVSFPIHFEEPGSSSSPYLQPCATTDARNLQDYPKEHLSRTESMQNEMFVAPQRPFDPAKIVLQMIKESFDQCWEKGDDGCEESVMINNISLLNDLMRVSPHIGHDVKKDALELAIQWKAKLRADSGNSSAILGFFQFMATYGLYSSFDGDEMVKLLGMIFQQKQAQELLKSLGFADKIPGMFLEN